MATILTLIDGSQYTESVVENAAFAAKALDAGVELVHVIGRRDLGSAPSNLSGNLNLGARDDLMKELVAHDEQRAKLARKRGHLILTDAAEKLRSSGIETVEEELVLGDLLEAAAQRESGADLVVIGKRGDAADFAKLHLGSNLERIMRRTTVPILMAARAFRPIEKVLIAYDGGPSIGKALQFLGSSPLLEGARFELAKAAAHTSDPDLERARDDLKEAGLDAHSHVLESDDVDEAIIAECEREDIDLVVVGASGHSRLRNFLVGSTTAEIVRRCLRPVLLFR